MTLTFKDLIAPLSEDDFFNDYFGKRYLHIKAADIPKSDKAASGRANLFGWQDLNAILNMALVWSDKNTHLVLDKKPIPAREFCRPQTDRNKMQMLVPDQALVTEWLNKGASIVLDDMDGLAEGSRSIAGILQEAFSAKVQANLYCSWKQRQAFDVHYDCHDVFAMHFAGEKVWNIYETRIANPVNHPKYQPSLEQRASECGKVIDQVPMAPGDILYLPKGQYHDALATEDNALHVAFGIHGYLGLDFVQSLGGALVEEEVFRLPMPLPREGDKALEAHIKKLAQKITALAESKNIVTQIRGAQSAQRYPHHDFGLPIDVQKITAAPKARYALQAGDFKVIRQKTPQGEQPVLTNQGRGVPMPPQFVAPIEWILQNKKFAADDIGEKFFAEDKRAGDKFLGDLVKMGVIRAL